MNTPWKHIKHKSERGIRFEVWKQYTHTEDFPWRRKHDRKFGFKYIHNGHLGWRDWHDVLAVVGRHALRINTFYDRHDRRRVVQVFIGTRTFLAEHFAGRQPWL